MFQKKPPPSKKRSAWYNAFYPSYKSRHEEFKKIFGDLAGERLIVGEERNIFVWRQRILFTANLNLTNCSSQKFQPNLVFLANLR